MKNNNTDNKIPNLIFWPTKICRIISVLLMFFIDILFGYYILTNGELFNANLLKSLSEFCMTVILAIVALGISVLQSGNQLIGENSNKNKSEIYIRYVFSIFPTIVIVILGFVVATLFKKENIIIRAYSFIMILMMSKSITGTMASFVSFLNIKD